MPAQYVNEGRIVLNIAPAATEELQLGNDLIAFSARFNGIAESVELPVASVLAVYSRESQHGMLFAAGEDGEIASSGLDDDDDDPDDDGPGGGAPRSRAHLRVIK